MKKTVRRGPINQESPEVALEGLLRTELHAFALKAGLEVLGAMFESEREAVCGPRYRHIEGRKAYRAAHAPGEPVLGGRRVRLSRPRAREVGGREVVLPSWRAFTAEDPLGERAYGQMLLGVATRGYGRSLEAVPEGLEGRGESKSAVSRRLVAATRAQLEEFLSKPLEGVDLKVLMLVGLHFGAGHRRRWPQAPAGPGRWSDGECRHLPRLAGKSQGAGAAGGALTSGGSRREQGAPQGRMRGVRRPCAGSTMPGAQEGQCARSPAHGDARADLGFALPGIPWPRS